MARPKTDDYPDVLARVVVALLSDGVEPARARLSEIAQPRRDVAIRKEPSGTVIASIYKRDRFRCRYCGCRVIPTHVMRLISAFFPSEFPYHPNWKGGETHPVIPSRSATLDHVVPWTVGGTNDPENLVCACWICNQTKGDLSLEQLGWKLLPISQDAHWDGLTRYYRPLWALAGQPTTADHPFWVRLFEEGKRRRGDCRRQTLSACATVALGRRRAVVILVVVENARYQVFVSSTFLDLQEERAAVVSALLQLEAFPAGMELFPAADDDAWTLIKRVIDSSDYYLLVIGGKYGSVDPETELSYTEKEYDYAVECGKPVMAFLHGDPEKIELGKSEKDTAAREKLNAFREKVKATKHVKYWVGSEDLAGKVALSFANFRQTYPAVGWIRGDAGASSEALRELNDLRKQLAELEKQRAVSTGPPPDTETLAQGDDAVDFVPTFTATVQRVGDSRYQSIKVTGGVGAGNIAWNELFSCVGPDLLHEASERVLRSRIDDWLTQRFMQEAKELTRAHVEGKGKTIESLRAMTIELDEADFGTLIVQLRALGLITKSDRPRSVKDTGTYWRITPHGDEVLTGLRAIRRDDDSEGSGSVAEDGGDSPATSPPAS